MKKISVVTITFIRADLVPRIYRDARIDVRDRFLVVFYRNQAGIIEQAFNIECVREYKVEMEED